MRVVWITLLVASGKGLSPSRGSKISINRFVGDWVPGTGVPG
jgi:hypothetical protein